MGRFRFSFALEDLCFKLAETAGQFFDAPACLDRPHNEPDGQNEGNTQNHQEHQDDDRDHLFHKFSLSMGDTAWSRAMCASPPVCSKPQNQPVVVSALCADLFEPQARRYTNLGHYQPAGPISFSPRHDSATAPAGDN
jgi:hypothetical protein